MNEIFSAIAAQGVSTVVIGVVLYLIIRWQMNRFESQKIKKENEREEKRELRL